jgi:hypothetical protein
MSETADSTLGAFCAGATPGTESGGDVDPGSEDRSDGLDYDNLRCSVDGCDTLVIGLFDGWEFDRGLVCDDCIEYEAEHGHWPDEDGPCVVCLREAEEDGT